MSRTPLWLCLGWVAGCAAPPSAPHRASPGADAPAVSAPGAQVRAAASSDGIKYCPGFPAVDHDKDGVADGCDDCAYAPDPLQGEPFALGGRPLVDRSQSPIEWLRAGDLDGDGDFDLASEYGWLENRRDGTVAPLAEWDGAEHVPYEIVDVDLDGDADVLTGGVYEDEIGWIENLGDKTFAVHSIAVFDRPYSVPSAEDLDGDGDVDLVVADAVDQVLWFENLGGGVFGAPQVVGTLTDAAGVVLLDEDGDGDVDVLADSTTLDELRSFENLGDGTFGAGRLVVGLSALMSAKAHDLEGDGDLDLVLWAYAPLTTDPDWVWVENLDGSVWSAPHVLLDVSGATELPATRVDDPDGDGDLDMLVLTGTTDVSIIENVGGGVFLDAADGLDMWAFLFRFDATVDIDGDGDVDGIDTLGFEAVLYEQRDGRFGPDVVTLASEDTWVVGVPADLDGDGEVDLLGCRSSFPDDYEVVWYRNLGSVTYGPLQSIGLGLCVPGSDAMGAADLDGDGDLDVFGSGEYYGASWYENLGNGTFGLERNLSAAPFGEILAADLDADGDLDLVTASTLGWFENQGGGVFGAHVFLGGEREVAVGDADGDGLPDLWVPVFASSGDEGIGWRRNLGGGSFGPASTIMTRFIFESASFSIAPFDHGGDGDLDVAWGFADSDFNVIGWNENLGAGTFGPTVQLGAGNDWAYQLVAADLDGDSDADIVSSLPWLRFFEDVGGTFEERDAQFLTEEVSGVADLDGDSDLDLVMSRYRWSGSDWDVLWYPNHSASRPADTDGDGVCDATEQCTTDFIDSDGDGVCDPIDRCVGDDALGDADQDGVCAFPRDGGPPDCDDADPTRYPGAPELCDGRDNACAGAVPADEADADADGAVACAECDDADAASYPGAPELCDGRDNACAGAVPADEADADADGALACAECDDADPTALPGGREVCGDGLDNDCDGAADDDCAAASSGCACDTPGGMPAAGWLVVLAMAAVRRRAPVRR